MKIQIIVDDVSGPLSRLHLAEVEVGNEVKIRREGYAPAMAAHNVINALRHWADDAERMFLESGVLPPAEKDRAGDDRELVRKLDAGVGRIVTALGFAPGGANFDVMVAEIEHLRAENKRLLDETARHESRLGDLAEVHRGDTEGFRELLDTMRTALADAVVEIDEHNAEYEHTTPREKLEGWRHLSSPDGEGMPAVLARLDTVGADPGHPTHKVIKETLERKMDEHQLRHAFVKGEFQPGERGHQMPDETCAVCGRDPRNSIHHDVLREDNHAHRSRSRMLLEEVGEHLIELVQMLVEKVGTVGVRRLFVSEELGLRLGVTPETPASLMTSCGVVQVFADRDVKKELTKGLLDALGLSMNMTGTHVIATIDGLPGLSITIRTEAARELHLALGILLGDERPTAGGGR